MKRSSASLIIGSAVAGAVVLYLAEMFSLSRGLDTVQPPLSLAVTLFLAAVLVVLLAVPVRRAVDGKKPVRVDPMYATRVLALAKATVIVGSLGFGAGLGIVLHLVGRPTVPPHVVFGSSVALMLTAALLVIGGIVAEHLCTLPPDDTNNDEQVSGDVAL